jgi:hypothetical protein
MNEPKLQQWSPGSKWIPDQDDHPSGARALLASHPRTALSIIPASLEAPQAIALLVGTRVCGSHDHAIISSTSWPKRSCRRGYREWARRNGRLGDFHAIASAKDATLTPSAKGP